MDIEPAEVICERGRQLSELLRWLRDNDRGAALGTKGQNPLLRTD
jgi:hypothetical protein